MTVLELIDMVLSKIGEPNAIAGPEIEGVLPIALHKFAQQVAYSKNRQLLMKDFSVTVTSGVGDLTTSLTASEPLLLSCVDHALIYGTSDTTPWQFLPDKVQLGLSRSKIFKYFTVNKSSLLVRNTDGSTTSLSTTATITGSYVPTITNVPEQLKDDFVDVVISVLMPTPAPVQAAS